MTEPMTQRELDEIRERAHMQTITTYDVETMFGDTVRLLDEVERLREEGNMLRELAKPITKDTSDGHHTFRDLYHHRAILFGVICNAIPEICWKSMLHHDGTMFNDDFIVGINTPDGQATYHYKVDRYWDLFRVPVFDHAPEWDGHTPTQAIERIGKLDIGAENAALRDELERVKQAKQDGRMIELPAFPQDMDDILEPLKVQSALNSEVMKLNFRKENEPKDVSILDYTIIAALYKALTDAEIAQRKEQNDG